MGGIFGGGSKPKLQQIDPAAEVVAEETEERRQRKRGAGRLETILTGELEPETTGKTLLG